MRTLAIETSSEACSIALFDGDALIAHDHLVLGRGHAEQLVPMIAALPGKGKAGRILVSLGPGSFTGVRIGIATARALGVAWRAEVLGYPTLTLVALPYLARAPSGLTVCMNGGHGEWFLQHFASGGEAGSDVRSLNPDVLRSVGTHPMIVGNRAQECAALFDPEPQAVTTLPDARQTALLSDADLTDDLRPIYGRAPDATPQSKAHAP